jgi:hypothetical protein
MSINQYKMQKSAKMQKSQSDLVKNVQILLKEPKLSNIEVQKTLLVKAGYKWA